MDSLLGVKQRRTNNFPGLSQIYGCKDRLNHMQEMTTPDEGGIPFFSSPIASGGMLLKSIILNLARYAIAVVPRGKLCTFPCVSGQEPDI